MKLRAVYPATAGIVVVAALFAACVWWVFDHRLEFDIVNEMSAPATVEVIGGAHWRNRPDDPRVYYNGVVEAGGRDRLVIDKPREDWTVLINRRPVTDASEWPSDNPQIELTLHVDANGSVSVIDS